MRVPPPKLVDILDMVHGKMILNIEVKDHDPRIFDEVYQILKERGLLEQSIVSSFNHHVLQHREDLAIGWLIVDEHDIRSAKRHAKA